MKNVGAARNLIVALLACGCGSAPTPGAPAQEVAQVPPASAVDTSSHPVPNAASTATTAVPTEAPPGDTEGDESLVGLLGTYKIQGGVAPGIAALGPAEIKALVGKEIIIKPEIVTPWARCDKPKWTHRDVPLETWLDGFKARKLTAHEQKLLGLQKATAVTVWNAGPCTGAGDANIEVVVAPNQPAPPVLVIVHDGVLFAAKGK